MVELGYKTNIVDGTINGGRSIRTKVEPLSLIEIPTGLIV